MKQTLFTLALASASMLLAGTASAATVAATDRGGDLVSCLHSVGKGVEHGAASVAHAARSAEQRCWEGTTAAFKDTGHAVVKGVKGVTWLFSD